MQVNVRYFGSLAQSTGQVKTVEIDNSCSVLDLLGLLGIKEHQISLVIVNGRQVQRGEMIKNGDQVMLISTVCGG